ncbi:MAG: ATP synthase F0 subunit B [candidate division WS1 bacterium]|jgi:F0F1-type ATP synthase membrane subunit b/b'|nr:ATP synthase F0 subunit B [candidate division WS1 bacterium]
MEILQLLKELEEMGERGERPWYCRVFLLKKLVLDADEFYDMVHRLRTSLPEEMTTATQVSRQRQAIIEQAHDEAQKIIDGARQQAQLLVSNDLLTKQAQSEAERILEQARVDSNAIRAEATQWARGMVERLDNYVGRISATIDKTKKALSTQGPGSAPSGATDTDSREFDE